MPGLPASLAPIFIPGQLPAIHSIFPLCFHGNVIAPGVRGPVRGERRKRARIEVHVTSSVHMPVLSSEAQQAREGAPTNGWQ